MVYFYLTWSTDQSANFSLKPSVSILKWEYVLYELGQFEGIGCKCWPILLQCIHMTYTWAPADLNTDLTKLNNQPNMETTNNYCLPTFVPFLKNTRKKRLLRVRMVRVYDQSCFKLWICIQHQSLNSTVND